jgi:hypothetical protein
MISNNVRANGTRPMILRMVLLLVCTATLLALLLLTAKSSGAQAAGGGTTLGDDTTATPLDGKADPTGSPVGKSQPGFSPLMSKILPLGVLTDNFNLVPGQAYSLIYSDTALGASTFSILHFTAMGATMSVMQAWIDCGYNPLLDAGQWPSWCPADPFVNGAEGPTTYWLGSKLPLDGPYYERSLAAGEGPTGWWLDAVTPGTAGCHWLARIASMDHPEYVVPIADMEISDGSGLYVHLRALYTFRIQNSYAVCNPPPGESRRWYLEGVFLPK